MESFFLKEIPLLTKKVHSYLLKKVHRYLLKVVHSYLRKMIHCYLPFTAVLPRYYHGLFPDEDRMFDFMNLGYGYNEELIARFYWNSIKSNYQDPIFQAFLISSTNWMKRSSLFVTILKMISRSIFSYLCNPFFLFFVIAGHVFKLMCVKQRWLLPNVWWSILL